MTRTPWSRSRPRDRRRQCRSISKEAQTFLDNYYTARIKRETGGKGAAAFARAHGAPKPKNDAEPERGMNPEGKPWTLEQMIEDPARINPAYK